MMEFIGTSGDYFVLRVDGGLIVGEHSKHSKWVKINGHKLVESKLVKGRRDFAFHGELLICDESLSKVADILCFAYDQVLGAPRDE